MFLAVLWNAVNRANAVQLKETQSVGGSVEHHILIVLTDPIGYAGDRLDIFCRAAVYVDKIRKGAKPVDLRVERPTKFNRVIGLRKALGLSIPPSLLARADQLIE